MLEAMIEFIAFVVREAVSFFMVEIATELGFRRAEKKKAHAKPNPLVSLLIFGIIGCMLGMGFTYLFPRRLIANNALRTINLFLTPLVLGLLISIIGKRPRQKGTPTIEVAVFVKVFALVFCFGLARYLLAK